MEKEHIEPRSAALVYSMSVWSTGKPDPIDDTNFKSIVQHYNLFSPPYRHFREYIEKRHPVLAEEIKKRQVR